MNRAPTITAVFCVLTAALAAIAQNPPTVESAQRLMIRQRYAEATAQTRAILKNEPHDIHALYTLATIEQTRILDYESYTIEGRRFQVLADSVKKIIEARIPRLRGADSVQALFYRANLVGGIGVIQAKCGDWIGGARSAMASVDMLRQVKRLDPGHLGAELGIGIFDYYLGTMFKWVPFVTGASVERGLTAIKRAKSAPFPFNQAARNTYCWILIDRKEYGEADSIARAALAELPDNSMFLRIRALIALWRGDNKRSLVLADRLRASAQNRSPVNWSDLITSYYITVSANDGMGKRGEAYAAAVTALELPMPEAYKNVPHVRDHLKYLNGVKGKYRPR